MKNLYFTKFAGIIFLLIASVLILQNCNTKSEKKAETPGLDNIWAKFDTLCSDKNGRPAFESFAGNYDLFLLPAGITPPNWESKISDLDSSRMKRWNQLFNSGKLLSKDGKKISLSNLTNPGQWLVLDEFIQAGLGARPHFPLIDQDGRYVHTAVFYNKILYQFMKQNMLYDSSSINKLLETPEAYPTVIKSINTNKGNSYRIEAPAGSMMIKTSWKVLGKNDNAGKFITSKAILIFENHNSFGDTTYVDTVTACLVGFHMAYKDANYPNWVWSTFEQINNVPDVSTTPTTAAYNFFTGHLPPSGPITTPAATDSNQCCLNGNTLNCTINKNEYNTNKWLDPFKTGQTASNIFREEPLLTETINVNNQLLGKHKNPILDNYILIGAQWATRVQTVGKDDTLHIFPAQQQLANSTLESYEQKNASCMGCHNLTTGMLNDALQQKVTNVNYTVPLKTYPIPNTKDTRYLYADFMWSIQKIQLDGHLSWYQIRPSPCK